MAFKTHWTRTIFLFNGVSTSTSKVQSCAMTKDPVFGPSALIAQSHLKEHAELITGLEKAHHALFRSSGMIFGCPSMSQLPVLKQNYNAMEEQLVVAGAAGFEYTFTPPAPWDPERDESLVLYFSRSTIQLVVADGRFKVFKDNDPLTGSSFSMDSMTTDDVFDWFVSQSMFSIPPFFGSSPSPSPSSSSTQSPLPTSSSAHCDLTFSIAPSKQSLVDAWSASQGKKMQEIMSDSPTSCKSHIVFSPRCEDCQNIFSEGFPIL